MRFMPCHDCCVTTCCDGYTGDITLTISGITASNPTFCSGNASFDCTQLNGTFVLVNVAECDWSATGIDVDYVCNGITTATTIDIYLSVAIDGVVTITIVLYFDCCFGASLYLFGGSFDPNQACADFDYEVGNMATINTIFGHLCSCSGGSFTILAA